MTLIVCYHESPVRVELQVLTVEHLKYPQGLLEGKFYGEKRYHLMNINHCYRQNSKGFV